MVIYMKNPKIHEKELAAKLEMAIKAKGLTKAEVARKLETTPQAVNGWVKKGQISKDNLTALANLLGRTVDSIINDNAVLKDSNNVQEPNTMYFLFSDEEMSKIKTIADYKGISIDDCIKLMIKRGLSKH